MRSSILIGIGILAFLSLAASLSFAAIEGGGDEAEFVRQSVTLPPTSADLRAHADSRQAALLPTPSRAHIPGPEHLTSHMRHTIRRAASAHGVPFLFLARLVMSESSGRILLIAGPNKDGTYDLGVIGWNSAWVGWFRLPSVLGWFDPFAPEEAVDAAARWCWRLYVAFGNWEDVAAAWKVGAATVRAGREGWEVRGIARTVAEVV